MSTTGEVTLTRDGKEYGATYTVRHRMIEVKTHTEVRSLELDNNAPEDVARRALEEIVEAQNSAG